MNRLFISTQEYYIPDDIITSADCTSENWNTINLYHEKELIGKINTSDQIESNWFIKHIFNNIYNYNKLIIDYTSNTITTTDTLELLKNTPKINENNNNKINYNPNNNPIQSLSLKDE